MSLRRTLLVACCAALPVTVVLDILLIPRYGISGAAAASSAAYGVMAVIQFVAYIRMSGNSIRDSLVIKAEDFRLYLDLAREVTGRD